MFTLSFKNRLAFYYIITTAILVLVVFLSIYTMVRYSVYAHINKGITQEVEEHLSEVKVIHGKIVLIDQEEWKEREHNSFYVNPVFIQFMDLKESVIEKSPNLKTNFLVFNNSIKFNHFFDTTVSNNDIRQIQVPIYYNSKKAGFLIVAMSLEDSKMVLNNLQKVIIISYPLVLLILFLIARLIAGRSIKPINTIIETSDKITKDNLHDRIVLPQNRDELYEVSQTINKLLDRLENTIHREKQFTSDVSHELRTPLSIIKGTLEVLIRKPREIEEYQEKINFCITEVDRINYLVEQLLLLTRYENQKESKNIENLDLNKVIDQVLNRFENEIMEKQIKIDKNYSNLVTITSDNYLLSIIITNLISNAIKYSSINGTVWITTMLNSKDSLLQIKNNGVLIPENELSKVFDSFYRSSNAIEFSSSKGSGLGLSIVKKLSDLLNIENKIESNKETGTIFTLYFNG